MQADLKAKLIYVAPQKVSTAVQPQPNALHSDSDSSIPMPMPIPMASQSYAEVSAVSAAGNLNSIDTQIDNLMRDKEATAGGRKRRAVV